MDPMARCVPVFRRHRLAGGSAGSHREGFKLDLQLRRRAWVGQYGRAFADLKIRRSSRDATRDHPRSVDPALQRFVRRLRSGTDRPFGVHASSLRVARSTV